MSVQIFVRSYYKHGVPIGTVIASKKYVLTVASAEQKRTFQKQQAALLLFTRTEEKQKQLESGHERKIRG